MDKIVAIVAMLAFLVLVGRGLPGSRWPVVIAATLAVILVIVLAENNGWWPRDWRVR